MIFRPGSIGALMDEYDRAARELKALLASISEHEYNATADPHTPQVELRSIQTMMRHVVGSGYGYATYISAALGTTIARPKVEPIAHAHIAQEIDTMLAFTDNVLRPYYTMPEDDMDKITMHALWNVDYTIDQMLEHAVMHIHRHRRQTEKYLVALKKS